MLPSTQFEDFEANLVSLAGLELLDRMKGFFLNLTASFCTAS